MYKPQVELKVARWGKVSAAWPWGFTGDASEIYWMGILQNGGIDGLLVVNARKEANDGAWTFVAG
jgi:apolipoprotein N-acyltransferase